MDINTEPPQASLQAMPSPQLLVASYNKLILVHEADKRLKEQLASAGLNRNAFFVQLASLFFNEGVTEQYAVCLVHRHYELVDGERMVTNSSGNSTRPSIDESLNVVADSWLATGKAFEYRYTNDPGLFAPPSADFFAKFKAILDAYDIDTLGICSIPDVKKLGPGFTFLEMPGDHDRERVTEIVVGSLIAGNSLIYEVTWIAEKDSEGSFMLTCQCNCGSCKEPPPTKPPTQPPK